MYQFIKQKYDHKIHRHLLSALYKFFFKLIPRYSVFFCEKYLAYYFPLFYDAHRVFLFTTESLFSYFNICVKCTVLFYN